MKYTITSGFIDLVVQSLSCVQLFTTPWTAACQASLSFTVSRSLRKLMAIKLVMPSNLLILCRPLLLPSVFPSIRVFSNAFISGAPSIGASASSVFPVNIHDCYPLGWTGLISLLSKGLSRVFSSITIQKHQIVWYSAFCMFQLSHPYMTIGKATALALWTFVGKMMSLLFNTLSRFIITFLPRINCLLISCSHHPRTGNL